MFQFVEVSFDDFFFFFGLIWSYSQQSDEITSVLLVIVWEDLQCWGELNALQSDSLR
jgi:DNA polymerase sigma